MLNEIFWYLGAKRQYDLQKEQGAAGLFALLSVVFIAWQWDSIFLPLFNAIGLVEIAEIGGLIDNNSILNGQTFLNIFVFTLFIFTCIGIITAIPMTLVLIGLSLLSTTQSNMTTFLMGIVLLPLALLIAPFLWLTTHLGVTTPANTFETYVKKHEAFSSIMKKYGVGSYLPKEHHLRIFAQQETAFKGKPLVISEVTSDEATTYLNRCTTSFDQNDLFLVGYNTSTQTWMLLLPTAIPRYASSALAVSANLKSALMNDPFNLAALQLEYAHELSGYKTEKMPLYVPAVELHLYYNPAYEQMNCDLEIYKMCVAPLDNFDVFYKMEGQFANELMVEVKRNTVLRKVFTNSIALAFYLPLLRFEKERNMYNTDYPASYYKALQQVPGIKENAKASHALVLELALEYARTKYDDIWEETYKKLARNEFSINLKSK